MPPHRLSGCRVCTRKSEEETLRTQPGISWRPLYSWHSPISVPRARLAVSVERGERTAVSGRDVKRSPPLAFSCSRRDVEASKLHTCHKAEISEPLFISCQGTHEISNS